jgi:hypothetical protein
MRLGRYDAQDGQARAGELACGDTLVDLNRAVS